MKISAVYKITNTITGDFYIGSSNDVKKRWAAHKWPSSWKRFPNNQMYIDMQKYGVEKFDFEVIEEAELEELKVTEQKFIETLKPTYNNYNANGLNIERRKEYYKSDKYKESHKKSANKYYKSDKGKESHNKCQKKYQKSNKGKESQRKTKKKYDNQLCSYNGQTITLAALITRFRRLGIDHPTQEAKKYLLEQSI